MPEPARAFGKRLLAGEILAAVGQVIPYDAVTVRRFLIDADHAVATLLEKLHDLAPAGGVVPVLALRGALGCDADVLLGNRAARVGQGDPRALLLWIDAENISGRTMQADQPEIAGLLHIRFVGEEEADVVGRVVVVGIDGV